MKKQILGSLYLAAFFLLSACGAANNDDRRDRTEGPDEGPTQQAVTGDSEFIKSQIFRPRGTMQISYLQELMLRQSTLSAETIKKIKVRAIPFVAEDIDSSVIPPIAAETCGQNDTAEELKTINIKKRIGKCSSKNIGSESSYLWKGQTNGIAGEGNWRLVTKTDGGKKVWLDETTNLVWSDETIQVNWFLASGAEENTAERICNANKAQLGFGNITAAEIAWRLPTRGDFLQADLNGARFVLPSVDEIYWTANYIGNDSGTAKAWAIHQATGVLQAVDVSTQLSVRCVGVILK